MAGLIDVGIFDHIFAGALVLLNLVMQTAFSVILLTPAFMGEDFGTKIDSAREWRTSIAHDYKYMDLAGTSLVTRVCNGDGSVILSTVQATLVEHVNSFLGMEKKQFDLPVFQPGVLLCMLCIVLWTLCVYKVLVWGLGLQKMFLASQEDPCRPFLPDPVAEVLGALQHALWLLLTYTCRTVIATVLLIAGILWLARTTSISELMLNAVALNAILDVDEFLFVGMTPIKIQHAIQSLEPMQVKYSQRRSELESVVHFISLLVLVLLTYTLQLAPLTDAMLDLKNELCGGNQSFVVGFNPDSQLVHALVTPDVDDILIRNLSLGELAVNAHKATSPETTPKGHPKYLLFSSDRAAFNNDQTRSMELEASMVPFCIEDQVLTPGAVFFGDPALSFWVDALLRTSGASLGRLDVTSCQEMADLCDTVDGRLLRMTCGETCGCADPHRSAWFKVARHGCSPACLELGRATLLQGPCEDAGNDENWRKFWEIYPSAVSYFYGADVTQTMIWPVANQTIAAMLEDGCAALANFPLDPVTNTKWCDGMPALFRPLAAVCPRSCGCEQATELPTHCPMSCTVTGNAST
ncbi:unnamed protein product [Symbiodinium pilosum]|uniref:Uncharacterized protein n=1 Tax=Symbiodinium pilosum TaxID=2952 RepID=A0A812PMT7_SYMPI|nr:unnamed protein product [Symbiodinium pilosum]